MILLGFIFIFYSIITIQVIKQCVLINSVENSSHGIYYQSASVRNFHRNVEALTVE